MILCGVSGLLVRWALRHGQRSLGPLGWTLALSLGALSSVVPRLAERAALEATLGTPIRYDLRSVAPEDLARRGLTSFGLVGPSIVLALAAVTWLVLGGRRSEFLRKESDPPLVAMLAAIGFILGRIVWLTFVDHAELTTGVRLALTSLDDLVLAGLWGYGLGRSASDGDLGGSPFGRYALGAMILRGAVDFAPAISGPGSAVFQLGLGLLVGFLVALGVRSTIVAQARPTALSELGQASLSEMARESLRGGVRPLWIILGSIANVGGIIVGLAVAVVLGRASNIDFGEIDRSGPGAEYAALLLVLAILSSFPFSAGIVGLARGGRNVRGRAFVLEAGVSALLALSGSLLALGVLAPIAVAVGIACAPLAFGLAALGAWIVGGRRN